MHIIQLIWLHFEEVFDNKCCMITLYNPLKNYYFEVSPNDLPQKLNWFEVNSSLHNSNDKWRLPSIDELKIMHKYFEQNMEIHLQHDNYWSGDLVFSYESDEILKLIGLAFILDMALCISLSVVLTDKNLVRFVRSVSN